MHLRTILNSKHKIPGFVFEPEHLEEMDGQSAIVVPIRPRHGNRPICSCCMKPGPAYDTLKPRTFLFVPFWGFLVFFLYSMRRVDCSTCGVKVEKVPWSEGKTQVTTTYAWFIASWAKKMSWQDVAVSFAASWSSVRRCVEVAVAWGRLNMDLRVLK